MDFSISISNGNKNVSMFSRARTAFGEYYGGYNPPQGRLWIGLHNSTEQGSESLLSTWTHIINMEWNQGHKVHHSTHKVIISLYLVQKPSIINSLL